MEKSKKFMYIGIIILLISVVSSVGTYAWFTWTSTNNTKVTLSVGKLADVTFESGPDINVTNLGPVFNYTDGVSTNFSITNADTETQLIYKLNLNINNIDQELISKDLKYTLLKNNKVAYTGDFSNASSGETMLLKASSIDKATSRGKITTNYTLYIWLDGNEENNPNMMNKVLKGTLEVTVESNTITDEKTVSTNFLNTNIAKTDITSLSILQGETPPPGVTPIDVSDSQDNSILLWYTENANGKDVTISSDSLIYGGANSYNMLEGLTNAVSIDLTNLNTSGMTTMEDMFRNDTLLENINFGSNFDTSEVTNMYRSFMNLIKLTSIDLSEFDTQNVSIMQATFDGCKGLTSLDVSNFNTSNVKDMRLMFCGCSSLVNLNLSNFNTSKVTNVYKMFNSDSKLTNIDLSNADFSTVITSSMMFSGVPTSATIKLKDTPGNRTLMGNFPSYNPIYISD